MIDPIHVGDFWADFRATERAEIKALDADARHQEALTELENAWGSSPSEARRLFRAVYPGAHDDAERCALLRIHFDDLDYPWEDAEFDAWLDAEAAKVDGLRAVLDAKIALERGFLPSAPRRPDKPRWRDRSGPRSP